MNVIYVGIGIVGVLIAADFHKRWKEAKDETERVKKIHADFKESLGGKE